MFYVYHHVWSCVFSVLSDGTGIRMYKVRICQYFSYCRKLYSFCAALDKQQCFHQVKGSFSTKKTALCSRALVGRKKEWKWTLASEKKEDLPLRVERSGAIRVNAEGICREKMGGVRQK